MSWPVPYVLVRQGSRRSGGTRARRRAERPRYDGLEDPPARGGDQGIDRPFPAVGQGDRVDGGLRTDAAHTPGDGTAHLGGRQGFLERVWGDENSHRTRCVAGLRRSTVSPGGQSGCQYPDKHPIDLVDLEEDFVWPAFPPGPSQYADAPAAEAFMHGHPSASVWIKARIALRMGSVRNAQWLTSLASSLAVRGIR